MTRRDSSKITDLRCATHHDTSGEKSSVQEKQIVEFSPIIIRKLLLADPPPDLDFSDSSPP